MKELKEILSATPTNYRLPILMQIADEDRENVFFDMDNFGNIFICGPTGTGKSSLMHHMISSLIYAKSTGELKLAILDGNGTEHCEYIDLQDTFLIGHPKTRSVDIEKPKDILDILDWIYQEVSRRMKLITDIGVKNILEYNAQNNDNTSKQLPDIVIFIDNCHTLFEFDCVKFVAALTNISRLGNLVGVHFVCITNNLENISLLQFLHTCADTNILFHMPDNKILRMLSLRDELYNPIGGGVYKVESRNFPDTHKLYIDEIDKEFDLFNLVNIASDLTSSETVREKLNNTQDPLTDEVIDDQKKTSNFEEAANGKEFSIRIESDDNSSTDSIDASIESEEPKQYDIKFNWSEWDSYKKGIYGRSKIENFRALLSEKLDSDAALDIAKDIDDPFFKNAGEQTDVWFVENLEIFDSNAHWIYNEMLKDVGNNDVDPIDFVYNLFFILLTDADENIENINDIPQTRFKWLLQNLMPLSFTLFHYMPDDFLPNLYILQFKNLVKVTNLCGIELPDIPKKANYRERCIYYIQISFLLNTFADNNGIYDPAEVCAFFFDFLPSLDIKQPEADDNLFGRSAWLLVGNRLEGEIDMDYGLWQANSMTKKGDLLFFYEKTPVKAMNSIWICREDGIKDPFFWGYSYAYIGKCHENGIESNDYIEIPKEQWITFDDFKKSEYFKTRSSKGNFVSKNFQDTSGWEINGEDFNEILRLLSDKGFDISLIPDID